MDIETFDVSKFDEYLGRGLCNGVGSEGGQVCLEAAVSLVLGEGLDDKPTCVAKAVRYFAIRLNDSHWSSAAARAKGLRELGLAQLGSVGVVNDVAFAKRLAEKHIRELLPAILREVFPGNASIETAAKRCEEKGSAAAARYAARYAAAARYDAARYAAAARIDAAAVAARYAVAAAAAVADAAAARYAVAAVAAVADAARYAAYAAAARYDAARYDAARYAAVAAYAAARYAAAAAARYDAAAVAAADRHLLMSAGIAVRVLREMGSPGVKLLDQVAS